MRRRRPRQTWRDGLLIGIDRAFGNDKSFTLTYHGGEWLDCSEVVACLICFGWYRKSDNHTHEVITTERRMMGRMDGIA